MRARDSEDDEASPAEEDAAYWRHYRWTTWSLLCAAVAGVVMFVFNRPLAWGDGRAATALYHGAQVVLVLAVRTAYVSHGRMAERRGFIRGRWRRAPPRVPPNGGSAAR